MRGSILACLVVCLWSRAAYGALAGDCDCSGRVTIDELARAVSVATHALSLGACRAADADRDGAVAIDELILAVGAAASGRETSMVRMRGVVEGFYGPPYTFEQRLDMLRFLAAANLNTYVYAPKLDPLHRERWRDPYPPEFLEHFGELASTGEKLGVRFTFALSPGKGLDPEAGDTERVQQKLASLMAVGVRNFCLFFDDVAANEPGADPEVQVSLVNATFDFLRAGDPTATLCFISNFYAGTAEQMATDSSPFAAMYPIPSSTYFETYKRLRAEIPILWTGSFVFSDTITVAEARRFRDFVGRPLVLWDNYPVNDVLLTHELFLGPYVGREPGLENALDGVLLNPMLQPESSKIALWTAGRLFAEGECYDPGAAWEGALDAVAGGGGVEPLRALAEQFRGHPLIGDGVESARFAEAVDDFFARGVRTELVQLLSAYAGNETALAADLANTALLAELAEPSRKLALLGQAGFAALELLNHARNGEAVDTQPLERMIAAANQIDWQVGANTTLAPPIARLLAGRDATPADVFGDFFQRMRDAIAAASAEQ